MAMSRPGDPGYPVIGIRWVRPALTNERPVHHAIRTPSVLEAEVRRRVCAGRESGKDEPIEASHRHWRGCVSELPVPARIRPDCRRERSEAGGIGANGCLHGMKSIRHTFALNENVAIGEASHGRDLQVREQKGMAHGCAAAFRPVSIPGVVITTCADVEVLSG
jgi:hypothetical protein